MNAPPGSYFRSFPQLQATVGKYGFISRLTWLHVELSQITNSSVGVWQSHAGASKNHLV